MSDSHQGPDKLFLEIWRVMGQSRSSLPDVITEFAIPFSPDIPVREAANLVQTTTVPGLCYQLHLACVAHLLVSSI